jgi:hypothetical protein
VRFVVDVIQRSVGWVLVLQRAIIQDAYWQLEVDHLIILTISTIDLHSAGIKRVQ